VKNSDKLKPCPCGKTPKTLNLYDIGQGSKWGIAYGDCCGEWGVEFRTGYHRYNSEECMENAIQYWNDAPRASEESLSEEQR